MKQIIILRNRDNLDVYNSKQREFIKTISKNTILPHVDRRDRDRLSLLYCPNCTIAGCDDPECCRAECNEVVLSVDDQFVKIHLDNKA